MLSILTGLVIAVEISLTAVTLNRLGFFDKLKNKFRKQNLSDFTVQPNLPQLTI